MIKSKAFLWGLIGFHVGFFSLISVLKYYSYSFHDFDLAVYAQGLWNLCHGSWESSILGIPLLGNHFVPIVFLIMPVYALFPTPLLLLGLQTLFLGIGGFFVYRIARRALPDPLPIGFVFAYLFYPALGHTNLFEFHPVALAVFFLLGALDAFEEDRPRRFFLFAALACLCQEDVSLGIAALGLYAFFLRRPWRWVATPLVSGILYFGAVVFVVMGRLNPQTINFSLLYSHLGQSLPEAFTFILKHPVKIFELLLEGPEKKIFVTQLLFPFSFLPLLDPKSFFLSVPFFLEQLLSRRPTQHFLTYHYGALFIPFLCYAGIRGAKHLLSWKWMRITPNVLFWLVFFATLVTNGWAGPHFRLGAILEECQRDLLDKKRDDLVKMVPEGVPVLATFEFLPRLSNRRELYSFHYVYLQKHTLSQKSYSVPRTIQYLLLDFNDPLTHGVFYPSAEDGDLHARNFLAGGPFRVVRSFQDLVLLEKGIGEELFWVRPIRRPPPFLVKDPEGKMGLSRWQVKSRTLLSSETLPITFEWYCKKQTHRRYGLLFEMVDTEKRFRRQYHSLCYRLYPTIRWQPGEMVIEQYRLVFPTAKRGQSIWHVIASLVDETEGKVLGPPLDLGSFEVRNGS
ncbi:MAG: DUF2079 domain-containing protein [Candidatus Omnitrophota bacterium]